VRAALGNSLNIPAVKAVVQTGVEPFHQQLRQLGFSSLTQSADWYGYSLALGSADVSLLMLTNAYRAMANGGQWSPLKLTPVTPPEHQSAAAKAHSPCVTAACSMLTAGKPQRAMTEQASFMVGNILSDRSARALTFGLESWLSTPYWSAVKTGTSKDMRDNWCIGYSSRYTVGVWVGNASGSPMHGVSGITGAAPVWREVMDWLHRGNAQQGRAIVRSMQPKAPSGLIQQNIRFEPRLEPPRPEWFIRGSIHEPKSEPNNKVQVIELVKRPVLTRIQYPAQGTVLALDADIPPNRQRIQFSAGGAIQKGWAWRLNGKALMPASIQQGWLPMPGRHRLELLNDKGVVVDEVQFTVRPLKAVRS
jgi:penicillin-binding protein 1C